MAVYLSRQDVRDLKHFAHLAPARLGLSQQYVDRVYPGMSFNTLLAAIRHGVTSSGLEVANDDRSLPIGAVGILAYSDGTAVLDDGSLDHPAREGSWQRKGHERLPEHGVFMARNQQSPVLVHTPHTNRHIPHFVRRDLLLTDDELNAELDALTDTGVHEFTRAAVPTTYDINWITATMSRLVIDVARLDWDPKESVGMGAVYTRTLDGRVLRDIPDDDLWWLQLQHRAYTKAVERYVGTLVERTGSTVILDIHSYGPRHRADEDADAPRPEVCFGTNEVHTPRWLREAAAASFSNYQAEFDTAFTGTYLPGRAWLDDPRVSSISIKVRHDLLADAEGIATAAAAAQSLIAECTRHSKSLAR